MDAITKRGYNPRNMLYLPFDKDPLNKGIKSRTLGMTLTQGYTWERMAELEPDPRYREAAQAVNNFINENYFGEDREYMQKNAQYINGATLVHDEAGPAGKRNPLNKIETEKHEVSHEVIEEGVEGLNMEHFEQEVLVRMTELRRGNPETKERATEYLIQKGITPETAEKQYGTILDAIENVAKQFNETKSTDEN